MGLYELAELHKHILVTGYIPFAPGKDYLPYLRKWFTRLVEAVDMKVLIPPKCVWCPTEGNEGVTGLVCIETSHSSIHFWDGPAPYFKFDLYSCKDFSVETVYSLLKELAVYKITYTVIDRTDDEHPVIESGKISIDNEGNEEWVKSEAESPTSPKEKGSFRRLVEFGQNLIS